MCWLMLLPDLADGITTCVIADVITICGRWNSLIFFDMADVVAIVADGIAIWLECFKGRSYYLGGRWKSNWVNLI